MPKILSGQAGQAFLIVLVFLMLGSLTLVPTLTHIATALKTGEVYEENTKEMYAADSGIEDGIWQIKYDQLDYVFYGQDYHEFKYNTEWSYLMSTPVNGMTPNITIENVWIPKRTAADEIPPPTDLVAIENAFDKNKLMVSGTSPSSGSYEIIINFTPDPQIGDNLTIKSVGVWLPYGFDYNSGSSNLEADDEEPYYSVPITFDHCGGDAVVWDLPTEPPLTCFPYFTTDAGVQSARVTFTYTPEILGTVPTAIAWLETDDDSIIADILPVVWDIDTKMYKMVSVAGSTEVEAYASRCELRDMNDAIAGDYVAFGNSLMTDEEEEFGGYHRVKDTLKPESTYTVSSIPSDADVIAAYLYWSGWRDDFDRTDLLLDSCSDFDNWETNNQVRVPTADGDIDGNWDPTPASPATCWDKVDETLLNPDNDDWMTGTTDDEGHMLFTFTPFTIPVGSSIESLTVYIRARDESNGNNDIRPSIKVNGTIYNTIASDHNPGTSWTDYSHSYTTNPVTGSPWTPEDINGTGSYPLQQFGVYSDDLDPDMRVSMVYAEVILSRWSIYSNQFRCEGISSATDEQRTLTLTDSLDLSSYGSGSVGICWNQSVGGTLEEDDALYFAFSSDNGSNWSSNIEAFHGDELYNPFLYSIPDAYLTGNFKIRFYFDADSTSEYVYLDNIRISYMPGDTSIIFKIDGQQVYLDGGGNACAGGQPLNAQRLKTMINPFGGSVDGYSYACYCDVSALVKKYPIDEGEEHHTGNAPYTVGDVQADPDAHLSYAGWSLIIVYASPMTGGHYLYLWDPFAFHPGTGQNLDFDQDGQPGGDVTGFIIPDPIRDEYGNIVNPIAAKLTCFVGEGDEWRAGEYIEMTGQQSGNSTYLSNPESPWNNVWNSKSYPVTSYQGVDVDTFEVTWNDGILMAKDTSLELNMYSGGAGGDAYNLIYIILSVSTKTIVGGTAHYVIRG